MGFVDIHHHLIYRVDDGPTTRDEMFAMLRRAEQNDVGMIVATSHVMPGVRPFDMDLYRERLGEARAYCAENCLDIEILPGAEVMYDPAITRQFLDGDLPTLGTTDCLLVEFPPEIKYAELIGAVKRIYSLGYVPILAHIERYRCLLLRPWRAYSLKEKYPVLYQVNASTLLEKRPMLTRLYVKRLLEEELIDFVATDAHNTSTRSCNMKMAHQFLAERFGREYADELTGRNGKSALFDHI